MGMSLRTVVVACIALSSFPVHAMDRDQLGSLTSVDRCPDSAETPNGFADHDGCPDTAPAPTRRAWTVDAAQQQVRFEEGAAEVPETSQAALAAVVLALRADPTLRLEIVGHASAREARGEASRVALSQRRAELVRTALVRRHGVDAARLTTRAAGDAEPIDSNKTARGRQHNRRVGFTAILAGGGR